MCGRFTNKLSWREMVELYDITAPGPALNWPARYNVTPTQDVPIVRMEEGADPQALLKEAAARLRLRRFEIVEPSLHQIFVQTVTADGKEAA